MAVSRQMEGPNEMTWQELTVLVLAALVVSIAVFCIAILLGI